MEGRKKNLKAGLNHSAEARGRPNSADFPTPEARHTRTCMVVLGGKRERERGNREGWVGKETSLRNH